MTRNAHTGCTAALRRNAARWVALLVLALQGVVLAAPSTAEPAKSERSGAEGSKPPSTDHAPDTSLSRFRTPFEVLTDRTIGSASKPVKFDWRRTTVQVAAFAGQLAELNNFDSRRIGGLLRIPSTEMIFEIGLTHVWVWESKSTRRLARTAYRQPARPNRFELDIALAYPLAEGVVTAWPRLFPATELVFNAYADFRYLIYPGAFLGLDLRKSTTAVFSPKLSDREVNNLDDERLPAMQVDPARYGLMVGIGTDIYFQSGVFISPRVLLAVPIMAVMTDTELRYWFDVSLAIGWAL